MGQEQDCVMAGLIFHGEESIDLLDVMTLTTGALKEIGQEVTRRSILSEMDARVETDRYRICLTLSANMVLPTLDDAADALLRIDVCRRDGATDALGRDLAVDAVLARVVIGLNEHLQPTYLQWVDEKAIISAAEVAAATKLTEDPTPGTPVGRSKVAPSRAALSGIDELHATLDDRLERTPPPEPFMIALPIANDIAVEDGIIEDVPEFSEMTIENIRDDSDKLRMSAWILSIAVACIALPVGLALMIINLVKGENVRLASQMAALSGLFVSFQANGATATALQTVQNALN